MSDGNVGATPQYMHRHKAEFQGRRLIVPYMPYVYIPVRACTVTAFPDYERRSRRRIACTGSYETSSYYSIRSPGRRNTPPACCPRDQNASPGVRASVIPYTLLHSPKPIHRFGERSCSHERITTTTDSLLHFRADVL